MRAHLIALLVSLLAGAPALRAQGTVPRPAPEFRIVEASGKTTLLSSFRGRAVLLAFISTQCPHCQRASVVFEQLWREFPGKVQVAEVAFDEGGDTAAFARAFRLSYPVGAATSDQVHDFLGLERGARLGTPQVALIDKRGVIRAQSDRLGRPILQTHDYLRELLKSITAR